MFKEMLSEGGQISCMRVMCMFALFVGTGIAIGGLIGGKDLGQLSMLAGVFIGAAFTGKVAQKFGE